jgi:hypothetical protein
MKRRRVQQQQAEMRMRRCCSPSLMVAQRLQWMRPLVQQSRPHQCRWRQLWSVMRWPLQLSAIV